uniref:SDR family NAD(P)-dependent oxidoreductase n=1 Tax=Nocardia abscessus TaxID=120957 RepID=UPI0024545300
RPGGPASFIYFALPARRRGGRRGGRGPGGWVCRCPPPPPPPPPRSPPRGGRRLWSSNTPPPGARPPRFPPNAGIGKGARVGSGRADANIATATTNFVSALAQAEAALEIFRARDAGHLVLVSSMSAVRGLPGKKAAYSASKAGLAALGEGLATELAGTPIAVTTLLPGFIATDMAAKAGDARMVAPLDKGVAAMVAAIEKERRRACVPGWPWRLIDVVLPHLPGALVARMS